MALTLGDLKYRVGATERGFRQTMQTVRQGLTSVHETAQRGARTLRNWGLAGSAAATAVAYATSRVVDSTRKLASEIDTVSRQTGVAVESLQGLQYAAQQSGVEVSNLESGLRSFARRSAEAARGNTQYLRSFERLGMTQAEVAAGLHDMDELFLEVADRIAALPTEAERASLAMNVMGDAGRRLTPLLSQGREGIQALTREAERLGIVLDADNIAKFVEYDAVLTRFRAGMSGLRMQLATAVLPIFDAVARGVADNVVGVVEWIRENRQFLTQAVVLGTALTTLAAGFGLVGTGVYLAVRALGVIGGILAFLTSPIGLLIVASAGLYAAWTSDWLGIRTATEAAVDFIRQQWDRLMSWWGETDMAKALREWWQRVVAIWDSDELTLPEKTVEIARLVPGISWVVGLVQDVRAIWRDEELTFAEKTVEIARLIPGVRWLVGFVEDVQAIWADDELTLREKTAAIARLIPGVAWLQGFVADVRRIWADEELTLPEKLAEIVRLIPGVTAITDMIDRIKEIWRDEELTLPEKVAETWRVVAETVELEAGGLAFLLGAGVTSAYILNSLGTALRTVPGVLALTQGSNLLRLGIVGMALAIGVFGWRFWNADPEAREAMLEQIDGIVDALLPEGVATRIKGGIRAVADMVVELSEIEWDPEDPLGFIEQVWRSELGTTVRLAIAGIISLRWALGALPSIASFLSTRMIAAGGLLAVVGRALGRTVGGVIPAVRFALTAAFLLDLAWDLLPESEWKARTEQFFRDLFEVDLPNLIRGFLSSIGAVALGSVVGATAWPIAIAATLAFAVNLINWNFVGTKIASLWDGVKEWWSGRKEALGWEPGETGVIRFGVELLLEILGIRFGRGREAERDDAVAALRQEAEAIRDILLGSAGELTPDERAAYQTHLQMTLDQLRMHGVTDMSWLVEGIGSPQVVAGVMDVVDAIVAGMPHLAQHRDVLEEMAERLVAIGEAKDAPLTIGELAEVMALLISETGVLLGDVEAMENPLRVTTAGFSELDRAGVELTETTAGLNRNLEAGLELFRLYKQELGDASIAAGAFLFPSFARRGELDRAYDNPGTDVHGMTVRDKMDRFGDLLARIYEGGRNVGLGWVDGLQSTVADAEAAADAIARVVADRLIGQSPPPEGPLSEVDDNKIIPTWLQGMIADMRDAESLEEALKVLVDRMYNVFIGALEERFPSAAEFLKGLFDEDGGFAQAIDEFENRLKGLQEQISGLHDESVRWTQDLSRGIAEAIAYGRDLYDVFDGFLRMIAARWLEVQVSQYLFGMHRTETGGWAGGWLANILSGLPVFHSGGLVLGGGSIAVMHSGGMVTGLRHDEVPAILQTGERVLSRAQNDRFERMLEDSGEPQEVNVNLLVNAVDASSFMELAQRHPEAIKTVVLQDIMGNGDIRRMIQQVSRGG